MDNLCLVSNYYFFKDRETFTGVVKDECGTIAYYLNGGFHRTDGPAIIDYYGDKVWYLNDKLTREDGPAVERGNGYKEWYLNCKCYGFNDDFTNESWIRFVQLELLK